MKISSVVVGDVQTNCYVVINEATNESVLIDPGANPERIAPLLGDSHCVGVLLTHGHFDHIGAADIFCERYQAPLYIHAQDEEMLLDKHKNGSADFGADAQVHTKAHLVADGDCITLAGIPFTVMHTPGHSLGGVCYFLPDGQGVFCGDTLFAGGYGRTDLYGGDFHTLKNSLRKLVLYPQKITAYPGHGGTTTCGRNATC